MREGGHDRRKGRGRLSSIELLPEDATPDIIWASDQLRDRKMHSNAILAEFNKRLADRGIAPISKSSWSRYAVRKAIWFRKLDEVKNISSELADSLGTSGADQVTMTVAEMVKLATFEKLEEGVSSTKGIMELARALSASVSAQKTSTEHRKKLEEELERRLRKAAEAVAEVGAKSGIGEETLQKITSLLTTGAA